ncbi:MAG: FAD-dependent oxidoreductase [Clostridia bacterium]|nr:FAD-dependent oxidoreductase [Clostridia bacterium]
MVKLLKNLKLPIHYTEEVLKSRIKAEISLTRGDFEYKILKKSLDARKKEDIKFVLSVLLFFKDAKYNRKKVEDYDYVEYTPIKLSQKVKKHVVVVGAGPCGLFSALVLAEGGVKVSVLERGEKIENRSKIVQNFFDGGALDVECNVQFGEGGAGAFSDGKLNTGTKSDKQEYVFRKFVECGAPDTILYDAHPHIGTDRLKPTVRGIREKILSLGGSFEFGAKVYDFSIKDGEIKSVRYVQGGVKKEIECDFLILATGHSARDVFELLKDKTELIPKPFSVGVRIEHDQLDINRSQFGKDIGIASEYKLSERLECGRGVYTFCMCPGGYVVPSASEEGGVVTNGMSNYARDGKNANSALLVSVSPEDFGSKDVLAGVEFQRKLERGAHSLGGGDYVAPYQLVGDFLNNRASSGFGRVEPTYSRGVKGANLNEVLPSFVCDGLRNGLIAFDRKLKGFKSEDAVMTGVETRSSSPVRIERREDLTAINIKNLYPAGEGAGYAGGITSSAVDGVRVAEEIINKLNH